MEVRVRHTLSTQELARRIRASAQRHDVEFTPGADEMRGVLAKSAGFLGTVRAEYAIEPDILVVNVTERPSLLPEGTLRRMIEDELGKLVAG